MQNEWDNLPFSSQLRMPITAAVPMIFRWKIMQMKLLLNDLKYLHETHKIGWAQTLYITVQKECNELCEKLNEEIRDTQKERSEY